MLTGCMHVNNAQNSVESRTPTRLIMQVCTFVSVINITSRRSGAKATVQNEDFTYIQTRSGRTLANCTELCPVQNQHPSRAAVTMTRRVHHPLTGDSRGGGTHRLYPDNMYSLSCCHAGISFHVSVRRSCSSTGGAVSDFSGMAFGSVPFCR